MYLVLTEKPTQAKEISSLLQDKKPEGRCFTGKFKGYDLAVFPLAGHIIEIPTDLSEHSEDFDRKDWHKGFDRLPYVPDEKHFYKRAVSPFKIKIYNELKKWVVKCDKIIIATDPDIEGAALGYEPLMFLRALDRVVDYIDMSSMNLIGKVLTNALNGKKSRLDFVNMAYQGLIRADFNYGIGLNISRYLMVKTNFKTTFGTQQTRLLDVINKRTVEYFEFNRKKYYTLGLKTDYGIFNAILNDDIKFDKSKVTEIGEKIELIGDLKIDKITRIKKEEKPLKWFDGSSMAQEVSDKLKLSPLALLDEKSGILEKMYLKKIMTYPRGDSKGMMPLSQFELQKSIAKAYINLIPGVENAVDFNLVKKDVWYEDGKVNVNHTPYTITSPDIDYNSLSKDEKIVFMTALKRLLSVFTPNPVNLHTKIEGTVKDYKVELTEISDIKRGYKDIYGIPAENCLTKDLNEGDTVKIKEVILNNNITQPKPLFTEKTIINVMKSKNIGAESTYKALIETISSKDRPYVDKDRNKLISTEFARKFLSIIPDEAVNVLNEFEEEIMNKIAGKKISIDEAREKRNELIKKTFDIIKKNIDSKIDEISAMIEREGGKSLKAVAKCPKCGGNIIEKNNKYVCENVKWKKENGQWKNAGTCDFSINKKVSTEKIEFTITKKILKELIEKNKSKIDVLFKTKNKKIKKDIILKDGKTELVF